MLLSRAPSPRKSPNGIRRRLLGVLFACLAIAVFADNICATPATVQEATMQDAVESQTSGNNSTVQRKTEWRSWRGPLGTGEAPDADPPTEWSETKNIAWKSALPGLGHSSPVIVDDLIFLTSAIKAGKPFEPRPDTAPGAHDNLLVDSKFDFVAMAIDKTDGEIVWQQTLHSAIPHEGAHISGSLASASPIAAGENILFFFGSYGLYCLSPDGQLKWKKDLGRMDSKHGHGEGSSPAVHGKTAIINWDHEGQSFVVALNVETGNEIWRKQRDEVTSWSSPIAFEHEGRAQTVVAGSDRVRSYDLLTGEIIWECGGLSNNIVATPIYWNGFIFVGSSYEIKQLLAIKIDGARGDITSTDHVVWNTNRRTPYVPSPVLVNETLYFLAHYQGVMTAVDAKTGAAKPGAFRIGALREIYSSPVAAGGRIYVSGRSGITVVVSADEQDPRGLAFNRLNDQFSATSAIAGDAIFLRGEKSLYCIRNSKSP